MVQTAHQEQSGVRCSARGYSDMRLVGARGFENHWPTDYRPTSSTCWATAKLKKTMRNPDFSAMTRQNQAAGCINYWVGFVSYWSNRKRAGSGKHISAREHILTQHNTASHSHVPPPAPSWAPATFLHHQTTTATFSPSWCLLLGSN